MASREHRQTSPGDAPLFSAPRRITPDEMRGLRLRAQCLVPRLPRASLVDAVRALCGVNAQLPSAMALSLRARVEGLSIEDIEAGRVSQRALVRTWCMRGTMHLLAADDVDWLLAAISPAVIRAGWCWIERRGGLGRERAAEVLEAAYESLKAHGPMTRRELLAAVAQRHGDEVKPAAAGVVHLLGILGRACFGPGRGAEPTYVALDDWLGRQVQLSGEPDLPRLLRRYLRGYGPAAPADLAAWWGLGLSEARAAWARLRKELVEVDVEGRPAWLLASESSTLANGGSAGHTVRLLPAFDTYLLGYRSRDHAVPPHYRDRVFHGGEMAPTVLVDGYAAGTWRYAQRGKQMRIAVTPFSPFTAEIRELIAEEADDIGRFFGLAVALSDG